MTERRLHSGLLLVAVAAGALVMLFPFWWMVVTSLTPQGGLGRPRLWPEDPQTAAYARLVEALPFARMLFNSVWIGIVATTVQVATSALAAYAFDRLRFPGRDVVFVMYLATLMIPLQVLVVPLFTQMRYLGIVDSYPALLAPALASAFGVFLLRQAVAQVPRELDEAATIDGAGHLRIFTTVIVPLVRPALATFAVFAFMANWNSFLWPLVAVRSPELMTLPVGLSTLQGQFTTEWNVVMAGSVVSVVPIVLFYLFAQRWVIASVARSGLR